MSRHTSTGICYTVVRAKADYREVGRYRILPRASRDFTRLETCNLLNYEGGAYCELIIQSILEMRYTTTPIQAILLICVTCAASRPIQHDTVTSGRCPWRVGQRPNYNPSCRCKHEKGNYVVSFPASSGAWLEESPDHTTSYDRFGNVIQKTQFWPVGCWTIMERCDWDGNTCVHGSMEKWRHSVCSWDGNRCPAPYLRQLSQGSWESLHRLDPQQCPNGKQEKHRISGAERSDQTPKRQRTQPTGTRGQQGHGEGADASQPGPSLVGQHENVASTSCNKCFMKTATTNNNPTPCGSGDAGKLIALSEIATQSAEYAKVVVDNEADLILSRGDGIFHWRNQALDKVFVCEKHYNELGRAWNHRLPQKKVNGVQVGAKCNVPEIAGANNHQPRKAKPGLFVTKEQSEILLATKDVFVPLGTGINKICF